MAVRSRPDGGVGYTFLAIVIRDTPGAVALFQSAGTVCKRRAGPRRGPTGRSLVRWDGSYEVVVFERSVAHHHVPGTPFWVIRSWTGAEYAGWYVNLASPWRRTPIGFDTVDHILDLQVADDLFGWSWKDEDELARALERGRYSASQAAAIRRNGSDAMARMEARAHPFDDDWSDLQSRP